MSDFHNIVNWENVFSNSHSFKTSNPTKFGFVENFFNSDFYEKLYQTFPREDDGAWYKLTGDYSRSALRRNFNNIKPGDPINDDDDPLLSYEWNLFKKYMNSKEFSENFSKYTGISVSSPQQYAFNILHKGDFTLPHNHFQESQGFSTNSYKLTFLIYFTKGWSHGEPGGTYIASDEDESSIIFEPYNLDNSMICFGESPNAWHGTRYITKDVKRQAIMVTMK